MESVNLCILFRTINNNYFSVDLERIILTDFNYSALFDFIEVNFFVVCNIKDKTTVY